MISNMGYDKTLTYNNPEYKIEAKITTDPQGKVKTDLTITNKAGQAVSLAAIDAGTLRALTGSIGEVASLVQYRNGL